MKTRFTILALVASLACSASAITPFTKATTKVAGEPQYRTMTNVVKTPAMKSLTTAQVLKAPAKADVPEGYASVTLTAGDVWGDGSGYQMLLDADATAYGTIIPETGALTTSGDVPAATYAEFEYKIPENADGALATQNIVINNSVTILIPAGTYDWCITNPTAGDRMWIASSNGNVGGRYDDFNFVSGATYIFTVSIGGQNDQVNLEELIPGAATIPTELTAEPAATYANMAWVPGENNATYVLRYRPYIDPALLGADFSMNIDNYQDIAGGFSIYDADGDGNNWALAYADDAQYDVCFYSESWSSETYSALSPDNWLITPEVGQGTLTFKTWNHSASWLDQIAVYVAPATWETIDEFVMVSDGDIVPGATPEEYTIDLAGKLGDYEGAVVVAFRHYGVTDMMSINVGYIKVTLPDAPEVPDWVVVDGITEPAYKIEGLTPETEYEAQVMAYNDINETDWTESTHFTTLAEDPEEGIDEFYLVGSFNEWNWQEADGRLPMDEVEGGYTITLDLDADAEFKIITPNDQDPTGFTWFGGVDENEVGYFLFTEDLFESDITVVSPGANFKVQDPGNYTITIMESPETFSGIKAPFVIQVKQNTELVAISDINAAKAQDNTWYNIQGMKIQGVPTAAGIYINGGKKVVIK